MSRRPRETFDDEISPPPRTYRFARARKRIKLDEDLIEIICERLADGKPLSAIADALCVLPEDLFLWKRRGEKWLQAGGDPSHEVYGAFVMGLRMATGEYREELAHEIHHDEDWFRYYKIAERRDPQIWAADPRGGHAEEDDGDEQFL